MKLAGLSDVAPGFHIIEVPVIDGVATLPDGRTVRSSGLVVRVPIVDNLPTAASFDGPDYGVDGCERETGQTGDHALHDSLGDAWADAEAALPEGWALLELVKGADSWEGAEGRWQAHAGGQGGKVFGLGTTPAAALRALAAKIREAERT